MNLPFFRNIHMIMPHNVLMHPSFVVTDLKLNMNINILNANEEDVMKALKSGAFNTTVVGDGTV